QGSQQDVPVMAEEVSGAGDDGDPGGGTEEVEESEGSPGHAQDSGERSGEDAHAEDEAGKEDGGGSVTGEHFFAALQRGRRNAKYAPVMIEEGTSAKLAERVAEVTTEGGG